jgi:outer membrane protein assembly factor BamB
VALAGCGDAGRYAATGQAATARDAAPCVAPPAVAPGPPAAADWPVYHRTPDRHGDDGAPDGAGRLAPLWGVRLDGSTLATPLVAGGLLVQATMHDSVYAFDAASGCLAWKTTLGTPLDVTTHHLQCNNLTPELGITATPAIDTTTSTVYVVAFLDPGRYEMDALDLRTGAVRWRHPLTLPGSDTLQQLSRPAVALANGRAYASFGGRAGDCGNYHGFVIGVRLDGVGPDVLFQASPNREGAVWAPGGPVAMAGGDLLVSTGNTDEKARHDGSDAVVRLSPDLVRRDLFAPSDWAHLNQVDLDLGSVGPTLLDGGRVFQVGKEGVGYLLDLDHLGGVGGELFSRPLTGGCYAIGTTAYRAPYVYVPCDHSLTAVRIDGPTRFDVAWRGPDFRCGSPIVAGGLVWAYDFEGGFLWGLDRSGNVRQKVLVGTGEHFVAPSAAAGRLYLPVQRRLYAFTLS